MMFNYKNTFDKTYIEQHSINKLDNFICGYFIDKKHLKLCDEIIENHIHEPNKIQFYGNQASELTSPSISKSLDEQLFNCLNNYAKSYPASVISLPGVTEKCIVQSSEDGKPFNSIETVTISKDIRKRHFGFLIFLNDVPDGGNLAFYHQKIMIKPEKGLIVLFPDNWQFVYSIEPSNKELFWLSGHISNITEDEKMDAIPKLKILPSTEKVNYKIER